MRCRVLPMFFMPGQRFAKAFKKDERGAVAIVFALMFVVVLMVMGGAVDLGRALKLRSELQAIADASVGAAAKMYSETGNAAAARAHAKQFFKKLAKENGITASAGADASLSGNAAGIAQFSVTVEAAGTGVSGDVKMGVISPFLKFAGIDNLPVSVETRAAYVGKELELSLMLDVTGSMGSRTNGTRKIDDLKSAANDLVDIFQHNLSVGATRIALVPFSESVNVGPALAPAVRNYPSKTYRFKRRGRNSKLTYKLTTCVTERNGNHRFTDDPPGPGRWLNPMYSSNGSCKPTQEIVPLTTNEAGLRSVINGFSASGGTAGHLGTAWAWYLINNRWAHLFPTVSQPKAPDPDKLIKATILMTDGDYNTEYCKGVNDSTINCNSPNGSSQAQAEALCSAMKTEGVVVYTVGFGIRSNSTQERLLKNCASDSTKHFFPYDGAQLRNAFREIGRQLAAGQAGIVFSH